MTLRHSHQCCGKPCRSRTVGASGFPASATCIRRPVESVTKAWVTPGSSGISLGCARPDAAGPRGASGVSVTTPLYYIRTTNSPPATCGARAPGASWTATGRVPAGACVIHGPSYGHRTESPRWYGSSWTIRDGPLIRLGSGRASRSRAARPETAHPQCSCRLRWQ